MKPKKENIIAYQAMIESAETMETKVKMYLEAHCNKYKPELMDRCIEYLTSCAREILNSKNGNIPDEVCYTICMDYFNDEVWADEDKEKAEKDAKEAERKRKAEIKARDAKIKTGNIFECSIDDVENDENKDDEPKPAPIKKQETTQLSLF